MPYVKVKPLECPKCGKKIQSKQPFLVHWLREHTTAFQDAERVLNEHLSQNKLEVKDAEANNSPGWESYWGIKGE